MLSSFTGTLLALNDQEDQLVWKWSSSGDYTASSVYKLMVSGGKIQWNFKKIWEATAPSKVKIFTFLLLNNRVLTHEIMHRRGISCEAKCVMCEVCDVETSHHLFFQCQNAQEVWGKFTNLIRVEDTVHNTWENSRHHYSARLHKRIWVTRVMSVLWSLRKQRNELIFQGTKLPVWLVANRAKEEAQLWIRYCGKQGSHVNREDTAIT